ncbi:EexN family lipoprotein [Sulfuricurvum sp.]|uniref:EexN family lipoprotein n=1 Tax=Sulfuricurvum sp. TaxID=2025608 RepID=UPI002617397F|nr:EexN family lipoprotein [Sulfuricurvum sp.]MDD4883057.1 EexN family lipoprotein [Sulfuricurvum sp.]
MNSHVVIEVKEASRFERLKRTRVPRWVMLLITFVPPMIFLAIAFTGCGQDVKTVEYYKEHTDERDAKISECLNNPGTAQGDAGCINAATAERHSTDGIKTNKSGGKTMDDYVESLGR